MTSDQDQDRGIAPVGYQALLGDLKERIRGAQVRAALSVNREVITLYWEIGRAIQERQEEHGWGAQVIARLSADLRRAFPDMKGFSPRTLQYMRTFAGAYPDREIAQQLLRDLPWGHITHLLDRVSDPAARDWYAREAVTQGWSRSLLLHQVEGDLYHRQGQATTNFAHTLPSPQSDLARQVLKDPYNLEFLALGDEVREHALERGLIAHIQEFLLELGVGFAFLGSQHRLDVDGRDYYIDLLFYHVRLHCYVVVEVKTVEFEPAFAGTMNFYLSAVDDLLRTPGDQPSIGIILCKGKSTVVAEYALRNLATPIGVSSYQLTEALPTDLRGSLPTVEELEATLGDPTATRDEGNRGDTEGQTV
jgi:predicted nuclease of restriction endonuclease-like (RecB) superfamily